MYFLIAGITSTVLWYVYLAMMCHISIKAVFAMSGKDSKFEFPFYLRLLYPKVVSVLNVIKDRYTPEFELESANSRWAFFGLFFVFCFLSWIVNHILPIFAVIVVGYLIISYQLEYGGKKEKVDKEDVPKV